MFTGQDITIRDGMDIAVVAVLEQEGLVHFAGAGRPLDYFDTKNQELKRYKGSRSSIGNYLKNVDKHFEMCTIKYTKGDRFYIYSDGYIDQFGGIKGKKYGSKRLKELFESIQDKTIIEQASIIQIEFDRWKEKEEQLDDVLMIGVEV